MAFKREEEETVVINARILAQLQRFIDHFPFYVILIDDRHRILLANETTSRHFGQAQKDLIGQFCPKKIHNLDEPFPGCPLEVSVQTGQAAESELYDPSRRQWFLSSVFPTRYRTKDGRLVFIHLTHDISEKKVLEEERSHSHDIQTVINLILQRSLENVPLQEFLAYVVNLILNIPWLAFESRGCIFLTEDGSDVLNMKAQNGLSVSIQKTCARVPFGKCLCGRAAVLKESQYSSCIDERHETVYEGIIPHGHYCVPILSGERLLGVINIYIKNGHQREKKEEDFICAVSNVLAGIIERHLAEERLRKTMEGTIKVLDATTEMRDPYTSGHQKRVADLALAIGQKMGLSQSRLEGLYLAAVIHDVGKVHIPVEILNKPGRLTENEFNYIKTHSQVGYDILKTVEFPWPIAQIVLQHHEKIDGSGYPHGLVGDQILLEAKIICVADSIEAMVSYRPYRPALGIHKALEEIKNNRGILYDENVVDASLEIIQENKYQF